MSTTEKKPSLYQCPDKPSRPAPKLRPPKAAARNIWKPCDRTESMKRQKAFDKKLAKIVKDANKRIKD